MSYWVQLVESNGAWVCCGANTDPGVSAPAIGVAVHYSTIEERAATHPDLAVCIAGEDQKDAIVRVDLETTVDISNSHSNKAREADLVKFEGVRALMRLPFLAAELATRGESGDAALLALADEVWNRYSAPASDEADRTASKRALR